MNQMKLVLILVIMAGLLIGVSSGGFLNDPVEAPSWGAFGIFDDYEPVSFGDGWLHPGYVPFNLSAWLYPEPAPALPDDPGSSWEPVPLVMPEPSPLSKDELFGSLTTVSKDKQSLLSSMKGSYYFG